MTNQLPPGIVMNPVESNHHTRVAHDAANSQLYVDFAKPGKPPSIYRYDNFGVDDFKAYSDAPSKGKHFLQNIKGNEAYPFVKLESAPAQ